MEGKESKELTELLGKLIRIPSVTGSDAVGKAIQFVRGWLEEAGITSELIISHGVPNLIARIGKPKQNGKTLLWNSHVDVVPAGDYVQWNYPPFSAMEENGYLYGRGASDAKSGLAAMMVAMKHLKEKEEDLNGEIHLMVAGAEENGSENGTIAMLAQGSTHYDAAIVAEPSDMCIEIAERGLRWIELRIRGVASHGARPHLGVNAISQASRIIHALEELDFHDKNSLFEEELQGTTISVNKIHGGIQNNIIPEDCKMVLDCRMMPGQTLEALQQSIQNAVQEVIDPRCHVEYSFLGKGWDSFVLDENEPIVKVVKEACEKVIEDGVVIRGKAGCTDASHIYKKNIPVLVLGPGNPNESHRGNEKVCIKKMEAMVEILCDSGLHFLS